MLIPGTLVNTREKYFFLEQKLPTKYRRFANASYSMIVVCKHIKLSLQIIFKKAF